MEGSTLGLVSQNLSLLPIPTPKPEGIFGTSGPPGCGRWDDYLGLHINLPSRDGACDPCRGNSSTHTQATSVTRLIKSERRAR